MLQRQQWFESDSERKRSGGHLAGEIFVSVIQNWSLSADHARAVDISTGVAHGDQIQIAKCCAGKEGSCSLENCLPYA